MYTKKSEDIFNFLLVHMCNVWNSLMFWVIVKKNLIEKYSKYFLISEFKHLFVEHHKKGIIIFIINQ